VILVVRNKDRIAFMKKIDCINKGIKKNSKPITYFDLLVKNILK
jgi:hypothetical protein